MHKKTGNYNLHLERSRKKCACVCVCACLRASTLHFSDQFICNQSDGLVVCKPENKASPADPRCQPCIHAQPITDLIDTYMPVCARRRRTLRRQNWFHANMLKTWKAESVYLKRNRKCGVPPLENNQRRDGGRRWRKPKCLSQRVKLTCRESQPAN